MQVWNKMPTKITRIFQDSQLWY